MSKDLLAKILIIGGAVISVVCICLLTTVSGIFFVIPVGVAILIAGLVINKKAKAEAKPAAKTSASDSQKDKDAATNENIQILNAILEQKLQFNAKANEKVATEAVTKEELISIFNTYFAPNKDFYSVPGSAEFKAYFGVVNAARDELINNQQLFSQATKWSARELVDLLNSNIPGVTNMMICGLIFKMGEFAVIKDAVYCVDFSQSIPNCIALYLLLIAQKLPADKRTMVIDAGDGADVAGLKKAMKTLEILDGNWEYKIY